MEEMIPFRMGMDLMFEVTCVLRKGERLETVMFPIEWKEKHIYQIKLYVAKFEFPTGMAGLINWLFIILILRVGCEVGEYLNETYDMQIIPKPRLNFI